MTKILEQTDIQLEDILPSIRANTKYVHTDKTEWAFSVFDEDQKNALLRDGASNTVSSEYDSHLLIFSSGPAVTTIAKDAGKKRESLEVMLKFSQLTIGSPKLTSRTLRLA